MKKQTKRHKHNRPAFRLHVQIQRNHVTFHISIQTRWLAAFLSALGLLVSSESLKQLLAGLPQWWK
jgi:hypothetical protein